MAFAGPARALATQNSGREQLERRIARLVQEFSDQGVHRTGTDVDRRSAGWLSAQITQTGLAPSLESFSLSRVDPIEATLTLGARRLQGVPIFDAAFTDGAGITGRLGPLESDAEIGLAATAPNQAAAGPLGNARRANRHRAIVCVTNGQRPGLCPSNADLFLQPFGPPVLQVSREDADWLGEQAGAGAQARLVAQVKRTPSTAFNVTTKIAGTDPALPPLVIMTPRSGWYTCASERGGGIVCWLELMRTLRAPRPARDIVFVASSGHELGHLGINAFVEARPGIVKKSAGWMHFGANIGAAVDPGNTVQASDDEFEAKLTREMAPAGLSVDRRVPRGTVPGGEAEVVHRGGGHYVSVIGRNALFHNPEDRGAKAVDPAVIARFVDAFTNVARGLTLG
ncbi:MAG: hypothetical protein LAO77_12945 [Acidobacteriia bacterium]|nr:hypothetical protein [Terriglobia bacterium]